MFTSKCAATLSKALAARSELAAAAVATVIVVLAASNNNNSTSTHSSSCERQEESPQNVHLSMFSVLNATSHTQCDAFMKPNTSAPATAAPATTVHRLARRRAIENNIQQSSTNATLASKYHVDLQAPPLGEGAFGTVHLGRHRTSGEWVAVKRIPKKFTSSLSFQREMEALLHIRQHGGHPRICGLRENFDEGGYFYLVLDLIKGGELFDHLCRQGPYSEADAARLIREVASALAWCHGIGLVHGDLKPENIMLNSNNPLHATTKLVDFGVAQVTREDETPSNNDTITSVADDVESTIVNTPAYCPPEVLDKEARKAKGLALYNKMDPSMDCWALGIILYIMLTGFHPFDIDGTASDEEIEEKILSRKAPPLRNSPLTAHLSESAISLIEQMLQWNPEDRLTAAEMLEHPWVTGETARTNLMAGSDKKLSHFKDYKSRLEAKVFADLVGWSDDLNVNNTSSLQTTLLERAFHNLDGSKRGYVTRNDLRRLSQHKDKQPVTAVSAGARSVTTENDDDDGSGEQLSLSVFRELLADSLKSRYFPKGHIVYRENDTHDKFYFLNSGTVEVTTSDGHYSTRTQGDTFGEGALLNTTRQNTSTIRCLTPVHAIEISREYFEKFLNNEAEHTTKIQLSEKDKTRKRIRAQKVLCNHLEKQQVALKQGEYIFHQQDVANKMYVLEDGLADVKVGENKVYTVHPGEVCGLHAVLFVRPRNTSTICVSPEGCIFRSMRKKTFERVLNDSPWWVKKSLRDLSLRRDFLKAVVSKTKIDFPATDEHRMREVFDIIDVNKSGKLELENIREMIHAFDPSFTNAEVKEILDALDLDETGAVSFEEFKRMFKDRPTAPSLNERVRH